MFKYILLLIIFSTNYIFGQAYVLNGSAQYLSGNCYELTPDQPDQNGTVWYTDQIDLTRPFDISFKINVGSHNSNGADGVVFVLQTVGNTAIGNQGDAMGYSGFSPSLGIEFDTYDNESWNGVTSEMPADHIAISVNGDVLNPIAGPIQASPYSDDIETGIERPVRITWNPATYEIKVYFDCSLRLTATKNLIDEVFNGNSLVYWGFTGATGGYHNQQYICLEDNVVSVPDTLTICNGESTLLDATGSENNDYHWTPNYNIDNQDIQRPTVHPTVDTTYYVTYTDYCNFTRTDSIRVIVNSLPQPDLGNDTTICQGENITLTPGSFVDYLWSTNDNTSSITVNSTDIYNVTVTNDKGCSNSDTIAVNVAPLPNVDAGQDVQICVGGTTNLSASGAVNYVWSDGQNGQNINVSPAATTSYIVTGTDTNGCSNTDQVTVTVATSLLVGITPDTSICIGDNITLTANGGINFSWSNGGNTPSITVSPTSTTTYTVTVDDGSTCSGTNDVTVTVNPLPDVSLTNQTACEGDVVSITASGANSYVWNTGDTTQTISVIATNTVNYSVTVTDNNSCSNHAQMTLTVNPLPNVDLGEDRTVCSGSLLNLVANVNNATYNWSTGDTQQSIDLYPVNSGTVSVTVTDNNNCSASDSIYITVTQGLQLNTTPDLQACPYDTVTLSTSGGVSYQWSNNQNSSSINVVVGTSPEIYTVTVSDGNDCFGYDTVKITPYELPQVDAGVDVQICIGETATLTASGANQYVWNTGAASQSIIVQPQSTSTYTVTGTDNHGCSNTDNVQVEVQQPVNISLSHSPAVVCPGESVILTSNISGGTPPYTLTFEDGTVVSPPLTVIPNDTTVIKIFVQEQACPGQVMAVDTIPVYPVPEPDFTSSVTEGCSPLLVSFNPTSDEQGAGYEWNFGNNLYSADKNPITIFEREGTYDVSLKITSQNSCSKSITKENLITVYPKPKAAFDANPQVVSVLKPEIQFKNYSTNASSVIWIFGNGDTSSLYNPVYDYRNDEAGIYNVTLIAVSEHGCKDSSRKQIMIQDVSTLYVPTAFTPDDDDINDVFKIAGNNIDLDNFSLKIYDRWGEIVFETNDMFNYWDGRAKDNNTAAPGIYIWRISYRDVNGVEYSKSGKVNLIR